MTSVEDSGGGTLRAALEGIIRKALQWDHRLTISDQCAPLPVGVNVYLFAQRYETGFPIPPEIA